MNENDRFVSRFEHENALMHYGRVNKRSLIALVCVCITFVLVTTIFVIAYTVREKNWLDALTQMNNRPSITQEAGDDDGLHEQPDP